MTDNYRVDISQWPDVADARKRPQPPGNFSPGSTYIGGPAFTDAFNARRAPSPWQLVEKYKSLIYAMVSKNANAVCRIPIRLYVDGSRAQGGRPTRHCDPIRVTRSIGRRLATEGKISPAAVDQVYEIRTHPILTLLDNPDPYGYFTRTKILSLITRYCDVVGSAFLMPDWDGWDESSGRNRPNRVPDYLWVLYSQYVLPIRLTGSVLIGRFQYFAQSIPYGRLMWFRQNHSLRDPYGSSYSPTYAGDSYAEQESKFISIYDQVLGLGTRPSMIATAKDANMPPSEDERKRLEQDMIRRQSGGYAGGILVNTGAFEFTPVSYSPADMGGKELSEYDLHRLASIFGQPPTYYTVDTNLANLQAADQQHARDGVDPRCKSVAETLTLFVKQFDERLFFAFDSSLPEDEELKQRVLDMQIRNGKITINQANEETQWPAVKWGDEPWMPQTLVQPSMAQEKHEQGVLASKAGLEALKNGEWPNGADDSGDADSDRGGNGGGNGVADRSIPAIHGGSLDQRFDAILTAMERSLGL